MVGMRSVQVYEYCYQIIKYQSTIIGIIFEGDDEFKETVTELCGVIPDSTIRR